MSDPVYGSGGTITLRRVDNDSVVETFAATDASRVTISGSTVIIDPTADLDYATAYYLEVDQFAFFSETDGSPFEGLSGSTSFNFTTEADLIPPELVSVNSGSVPVSADLVLTFSEAVNGSGGAITLKRLSDHAEIETFTAADFGPVAINGSTVTINPTADLDYSTVYYLEIQDGAFNDGRGNFNTAVTGSTYSFITAAPPPPPTSDPTPPSPTTVDGVPVQTGSVTNSDGTTSQTITIPVVTASRTDQVGNNNMADIPLVTGGGANLLTAQVPTGFGLTVSGSGAPKAAGSSLSDLIREIQTRTTAGSADQAQLTGGGSGFLQGLPADAPLLVQTIVPTTAPGATAPGTPLVITGTPAGAGPTTALVIDTRNLPSGSEIQLQNVEFAAVIGAARVTGGEGSQSVWGDGASQYIVLGADDDTLHGGGGDDFVGSKTGNDVLYGDEGNDTVQGGEDHDTLFGGSDNDLLLGNTGADVLFGNTGADTLYGGRDNDTLYGGRDNDALFGDDGSDVVNGDLGDDALTGGADNDTLSGGDGADLVFGNTGSDLLFGNMGADTLYGGMGNDTLYSGRDDDLLFGDLGDDLLFGDLGNDTLTGGGGADVFVFGQRFAGGLGDGHDVITDFNAAEGDRIQLKGGLTYTLTANGAGDAVIVFSSNDDVTLAGVRRDQVQSIWFVTG
ncbi:Ca2+-binding RTX toxin-like protein [Azospirillum soli]|nr:Ca2+-binding RTX toxin-like protein [Azospirillum soli]